MTRFSTFDRVMARALVWALLASSMTVSSSAYVASGFSRTGGIAAYGLGQANGQPSIIVNGAQPPDTLTVSAGMSLAAGISNGPANTTDWVALYQSGAADGVYLAWKYLSDTTAPPATGVSSATVTFDVPAATGNYELRFFANNGYTRLATSATIAVTASPARITVNGAQPPDTAAAVVGGALAVTVSDSPGNTTDWIGVFHTGDSDTTYLDWRYLNGTTTAPASGVTSAALTLNVPATPGDYELRLFANNGYTRLTTSAVVAVTPSPARVSVNGVLPPTTVTAPVGTHVTVGVTDGPGNATDWVGLYPLGALDTGFVAWKYLNGTLVPPATGLSNATLTFDLPSPNGQYEFRLFAGQYTRLSTSTTLSVTASPATLTVNGVAPPSPVQISAGARATVAVASGPANAADWVGLYAAGATDTAFLSWQYLNGTTTPPVAGTASATLTFGAPTDAGQYELRFFADNGYTRLTTSAAVTVAATAQLTVNGTAPPTQVSAGAGTTATVGVTGGPANPTDWVGIFAAGAQDAAYLDWFYLNGTKSPPESGSASATLTLALPATAGAYEIRFFANNGYGKLATSSPIAVTSTALVTVNDVAAPGTLNAAPGAVVSVHVTGGPANATDWVALAQMGTPDTSYISWLYLSGTQAPPATGLTEATLSFTLPATPGQYEFRFFANNGYQKFASSGAVSIGSQGEAPVVQVIAPAAGAVVKGPSIQVNGSVTGTSIASVTVNGTAATLSGSSFTATITAADGPLTIAVLATDAAGQTGTANVGVTIDGTAPVISIVSPADGQFTNATALDVTGGVTDATIATVTVNGTAATVSATGTSRTFTAAHVPIGGGPDVPIQVVATDTAGNTSNATVTVHVDRLAPSVAITSPAAGAYTKGPVVHVTGTVSDTSPALVEVNGQLATLAGGTFDADVPTGGDGALTLVATARDAAANASSADVAVTVDSTPPAISVSSPAQGSATSQTALEIDGTVSDASPVTLAIGPLLVPTNAGAFTTVAALAGEGAKTITLTATDAAGNQSSFDVQVTFDQTPSTLTIESPGAGAILGSGSVSVQGFVYDLTAVGVTVNGVAASRAQDGWNATVTGLDEGPQTLTVVATDAAGNTQTLTRSITIDLGAPLVSIASPAAGTLTNASSIVVSGLASDATLASVAVNGVPADVSPVASGFSRTFTVAVPLADGDNHLVAVATDSLGRAAQAEVVVTRDAVAPVVSIDAPATIARGAGATATISASDTVGLAQVSASLDGTSLGSSQTSPLTVQIAVPASANDGDVIVVTAVATDRAGNTATTTASLRVTGDGVVAGQVLSDATGLPLAGAMVTDVASGSTRTDTTDDRGQYSIPAVSATVLLSMAKDGMTTVERQVPIQQGGGTAVIDARLTPITAPVTIGSAGGSIGGAGLSGPPSGGGAALSGPPTITATIAPGALASPTALSLTPLSPQGLPALLPLGWSPLGAFDLRGAALSGPPVAVAVANIVAADFSRADGTLVAYDTATHAWTVVTTAIAITNGAASFSIPNAGAYALVVPDVVDPPIVVADAGQPLTGTMLVALPADATATGALSPATLPPAGGTATATLGVLSSTPLVSGTVISVQVTETFGLANGQTASEEQRTEDIVLYRTPSANPSNPSNPSNLSNPALSAFFPVTPSRTYQATALAAGTVHLDILAGRESVRGQIGGDQALAIDAGGGVTLTVPAHALPRDTVVRVQPAILSGFLPGAMPNTASADVVPVGELVVDFASDTLALGAQLSVAAGSTTATDTILVARVVRIDGIPRLLVVARGDLVGDRLVSRAVAGLEGITRSGRYVFYRLPGSVGFVAGTLSAAGSPVAGYVDTTTLPFVGVSGSDGLFVVASRAAGGTLTGHVTGTGLSGSASVTAIADQTVTRDVALTGTVTVATVTPADGATLVERTAQIELTASAALDAASMTSATITLVASPESPAPSPVALRPLLSGSGQVLAIVPDVVLDPATTYRLSVSGLRDVYGAAVSVTAVTFTTRTDAPATYDPRKVVVSMPDADGIAHITAAAGSVAPLTQVVVINEGQGSVASFQADNDGALNGEVVATVEDRLLVTITDLNGASTSFERGAYVSADQQSVAVNSAGGRVTEPGQAGFAAGAQLVLPPETVLAAVFFHLQNFDKALLMPEDPLPELPDGVIGATVQITSPQTVAFKKEATLVFERPAGAPDDAAYVIYKRIDQGNGTIAWAVLDQAALDPVTNQVTTQSPPYPGVDGSGNLFATLMYTAGPHSLPGFITGVVRRAQRVPGSTAPTYVPVEGAKVSAVGLDGRPLYAAQSGATVAFSQANGTFALLDKRYAGGQIVVSAELDGQVVQATAFEANPQDSSIPPFVRSQVKNVATVNLTLPALEPAPVAPGLDIVPFVVGADGTRTPLSPTAPLVTVGSTLTFKIDVTQDGSAIPTATAHQTALNVTADTTAPGGGSHFLASYVAAQAGTVFVSVSVSGVTRALALRVVAPGGTTRDALPNDPPAVLDSATSPRRGATGVQPTAVIQLRFTEPVTHVTHANVQLTDASGTAVPYTLSGAGLTGPLVEFDQNAIVTGLTLQPSVPLDYGTTYTLTLTSDIRDTDVDPTTGEPLGKPLVPYTTTFTTFQPQLVGQTTDTFTGGGLAVIDDRAYVAQNLGMNTTLRLFDVSNPTAPTEITPNAATGTLVASPPITRLGHPADLRVQDSSPVLNNAGRLMAVALTNFAIPYHPSNLYLYDVSADQTWSWMGAVTLGTDPLDGLVRRIRLKDGYVYAATTGIGKGIQVVDLNQAASLFAAKTASGEGSTDYADMQRRLALQGQGFAQGAIVQTIPVRETGLDTTPTTNNLSVVLDLDVLDLTVDGAAQRMVVATGRQGLTIANPATGQLLWNARPVNASGADVLGWGSQIAAATINGRPLAAVLGYGPGAGAGTTPLHVVILDLSDARHPVAIGDVVVPGVTPGLYADLVLQDDRIYVGGDTATVVISLADPAHPELLGSIAGLAGRLSFTSQHLLFSNAVAWADQQSSVGGVRSTVLETVGVIQTVSPPIVSLDEQGQSDAAIRVTYQLVAAPGTVQRADIQLMRDGEVVASYPITDLTAGAHTLEIPKGVPFDIPSEDVSVSLTLPDGTEVGPIVVSVEPSSTPGMAAEGGIVVRDGGGVNVTFDSLSPATVSAGSGDKRIVVTGTSLLAVPSVFVSTADRRWQSVSIVSRTNTSLEIAVPGVLLSQPGFVKISPTPDDAPSLAILVADPTLPPATPTGDVRLDAVTPTELGPGSGGKGSVYATGSGFRAGMSAILSRGGGGVRLDTTVLNDTTVQVTLPMSYLGWASDLSMAVVSASGVSASGALSVTGTLPVAPAPDEQDDPANRPAALTRVSGLLRWNSGTQSLLFEGAGLAPGLPVKFTTKRGTFTSVTASSMATPKVSGAAVVSATVPSETIAYPGYGLRFAMATDVTAQAPLAPAPPVMVPVEAPVTVPFGGRTRLTAYEDPTTSDIRLYRSMLPISGPATSLYAPSLSHRLVRRTGMTPAITRNGVRPDGIPYVIIETDPQDPEGLYPEASQ